MALRVLLADESSTIRKVFQLALQDYAVDVKAVHNGLDVLAVGKQFKPDIIFADVLLAKKSGYDVASELKNDADITKTPVILMWSSFMELDRDKFSASKAEAHLEKPFDVQKLRGLIQQFVPKTKDQFLSKYLTFPEMPAFEEAEPPAKETTTTSTQWTMESFDHPEELEEVEEFQAVPLKMDTPQKQKPSVPPRLAMDDRNLVKELESDSQSDWQPKPLKKFRIDPPPETEDDLPISMSEEEVVNVTADEGQELEVEIFEKDLPLSPQPPSPTNASAGVAINPPLNTGLSQERLEEIVREECQKMLQSVIWKVVPELAKSLIEKELNELLADVSETENPNSL